MVSKSRIEALSDGLFAIVLTLLVLEIKPPAGVEHGKLGAELAKDLTSWVSFAFTFMIGSIFWVDQHRVLKSLSEISHISLSLNLLFLAFVSVLPFSTSVWGRNPGEHLATTIYFANMFAGAAVLTVLVEAAVARKEVVKDSNLSAVRFRLPSLCVAFGSAAIFPLFFDPKDLWKLVVPLLLGLRVARGIRKRKLRAAERAMA